MAVDYFLKLDEIPGESQDTTHKGEIDVLSWHWDENQNFNPITGAQTAGRSQQGPPVSGKVWMSDFHFTMLANKASPRLLLACATGKCLKQAVLTCRKAGDTPQEYLKFTLTGVAVTSYRTGGQALPAAAGAPAGGTPAPTNGRGPDDCIPTDQVTLSFGMIEAEYKEQKSDGSLGAPVVVSTTSWKGARGSSSRAAAPWHRPLSPTPRGVVGSGRADAARDRRRASG
jgi:type VI secretion system secreted protein Hcp